MASNREADGVRSFLARLAALAPGRQVRTQLSLAARPAELTPPGRGPARTTQLAIQSGPERAGGAITWLVGRSASTRLGSLLVAVGLLLVLYSLVAYLGWLPGGYTSIPQPIALSGGQREAKLDPARQGTHEVGPGGPRAQTTSAAQARNPFVPAARPQPTFAPRAGQAVVAKPTAPPRPAAAPVAPAVALKLEPADLDDRRAAALAPRPGLPTELRIASVGIETDVREGGIKKDKDGAWEWETLPFVATSYPFLGPVGLVGNPVISGHVVTLHEGNVFRDLYRVELGDEIEVFTDRSRFTYVVDEIKLVPPTAVEVLLPVGDARLTVITCGGVFDPAARTFSERLILVGKLAGGERL
jgi:LPXTG-site transpeptidase (sortase) family protein